MDEKERLSALSEQYYTERESILMEREQIQKKLETSDVSKLEQKVKRLEEERSEMKSDFYIKINSFVQEIDHLKGKLSRK